MDRRELVGMVGMGPRAARGLAVLLAAALAGSALLWWQGRPAPTAPAATPPLVVTDEPLVVHVAGHVSRPGLYRLAAGARVADALDAAGGALPDAVLDQVNLARLLEDGERILVPGPASADAARRTGGLRADGRLDLNRATASELEALPGVGPVLSSRILHWRERHGPFRSVRDLRRVQGIGEKLYRALSELVAV